MVPLLPSSLSQQGLQCFLERTTLCHKKKRERKREREGRHTAAATTRAASWKLFRAINRYRKIKQVNKLLIIPIKMGCLFAPAVLSPRLGKSRLFHVSVKKASLPNCTITCTTTKHCHWLVRLCFTRCFFYGSATTQNSSSF
jgi:hypothetical protein